jgi:aspartyl protease family protein
MARTYLIFLLLAGFLGAVLGTCSSRSVTGTSAGGGAAGAPGRQKADQPLSLETGNELNEGSDGAQDSVELKRQEDGHFYADVEINNMPIRILVDTGASGIALSRDDARRAGLSVSVGMFDVVGEGAGGDVKGEFVTLDTVRLGKRTARQMPAVILDGGEQSLLGQSFLRQFQAVEIRNDTMVLR